MLRKHKSLMVLLLLSLFLLAGCAYSVAPLVGTVYTDVKAPITATDSDSYSKVGTAEATSVLGIVATGDASIEAAMKNGGISKVHHVDYHSTSILGLYAKFVVTVYGE